MKALPLFLLGLLVSCSSSPGPIDVPVASSTATAAPSANPTAAAKKELLSVDSERTTPAETRFVGPAGFTVATDGPLTIVEAPEADSRVAIVDVDAEDADAAVAAAWKLYRPDAKWPLKSSTARSDEDGWTQRRIYIYQTSPNERRDVRAGAMRRKDGWTVWIYDVFEPTGEKRGGQFTLVFDRLYPKGYTPETFAGRKAQVLDDERFKKLSAFIEKAQVDLGIPGVAVGIVQNGKTVFAKGFGVKELGKPALVDADTLFIIASNTKALTTLMLGKLVDEKKLTWDSQVTSLLPQFKLGDADTTSKVLVRHLVCACTGLPRQDFEWLLEFEKSTPETMLSVLGTMQPTSKFGEMFQYSNPLAAAGGYVGGHVLYPKRELGAAYDEAMKTRVFGPLGMKSTTFDFARALRGNHATAHSLDVDDKTALAAMDVNYAIGPVRPAGGAWSSVHDMLKYVSMELARGKLPDGKRYVSEEVLSARLAPQVAIGRDTTYGMGLEVETTEGIPVVHHGGSMIGYKSDMIWVPDHGIGAVILTNSDTGGAMIGPFRRKLLELAFDGESKADGRLDARGKAIHTNVAADRKLMTLPPQKEEVAKLAAKYANDALGPITVERKGDTLRFDFGEWQSHMASKKHPDGSLSFITVVPGMDHLEFVVGDKGGKRTLLFRDAQHEYLFTER